MTQQTLHLSNPNRTIAYNKIEHKDAKVTLLFLCGLMSDKDGTKALYLEDYAIRNKLNCVRFDYQGHGQSSGEFIDGSISLWQQDTLAIIDQLTTGSLIIIGSSMGGWQMLLAALNRPERVKGLVGIAPAPDFTQEIMENSLPDEVLNQLSNGDVFKVPSEYAASGYPITKRFLDDGKDNNLLDKTIDIHAPLHIMHGIKDISVPYQTAFRIMNNVVNNKVYLHLIKDGDHRLSREQDLGLLGRIIDGIIEQDL